MIAFENLKKKLIEAIERCKCKYVDMMIKNAIIVNKSYRITQSFISNVNK